MIKFILIALAISLNACGAKEDLPYGHSSTQQKFVPNFETVCLGGIEYWP